jgi:N-acetylglucosamine-6-phosphate deacetylase
VHLKAVLAFGIDFMTATKEQMSVLCAKLVQEGYEGFLPTTVT